MVPVAVVLAAGQGERYRRAAGDPTRVKLLANIQRIPLLDRTIASLWSGGVEQVVVVVAPHSPLEAPDSPLRSFGDPRVRLVRNPDPGRGMFSSMQTGLAASDGDPVLIVPGDMPFVAPATVAAVLDACRQRHAVILPRARGKRGHPIALPASLRTALLAAAPDRLLGDVLRDLHISRVEIEVADPGILHDVDVPADLDAPAGESC